MPDRRAVLKVGLGASLSLALGGALYRLTRAPVAAQAPFVLDGAAHAALLAIVPAILEGALVAGRASDVEAVIARVHDAIRALPPNGQQQVADLFGLLALAPARRLLTGIGVPWERATPAQVHGFLQDWRVSRLGSLRVGYGALQNLVMAAWYAVPASWAAIGYPGPQLEWAP